VVFAGIVAGLPLPLLPIQILWINLVSDGLPALALGMEPGDPDAMGRPPRPPWEPVVTRPIAAAVVGPRALVVAGVVLTAFLFWLYALDASEEKARTMAFVTLILAEDLKAHGSRSLYRTIVALGPLKNLYLVGATAISWALLLLILYVPLLQDAFHAEPLSGSEWLAVAGLASLPLLVIEAMKVGPWRLRDERHPAG